ncbi:hypothetical protein ANOM_004109 [Aspergillus nomiae NRRL 13137]|uniref:Uncharacterized protein n=1 Tax=Aspergillus nomiae NRRL (strain ATCC 15546 / NRRL 13137 / CBS 260.88 / M93) TaxID=1509407 RepID=A0A0L1J8I4_ASPN3|nr:uncharacterized protein ANOM_004109 [Aspergillus nomiae NRRL 13137]KNG88049.1 hypothetical protein ANOM_004109 [Aspergillus nomiae NRRL 13137]
MNNPFPQSPKSPAEWEKYATSPQISGIPLKAEGTIPTKPGDNAFMRDVYIDVAKVIATEPFQVTAAADVLGFHPDTTVDLSKTAGGIQLYGRVLTADSPVNIKLQAKNVAAGSFTIYGTTLDQKFTYSIDGVDGVDGKVQNTLSLGPGTGNIGLDIVIDKSTKPAVTTAWIKDYSLCWDNYRLVDTLATQLRIASILFWSHPDLALALTVYVGLCTGSSAKYDGSTNLQAVSLGQQLAIQKLLGPTGNYVPVLAVDKYIDSQTLLLNTGEAFQTQYQRFQDRNNDLRDRHAAWTEMASKAGDQLTNAKQHRDEAEKKYKHVLDIVGSCEAMMKQDEDHIKDLGDTYKKGLNDWQKKQKKWAIFKILGAIADFGLSIGMLLLGSSGGSGPVSKAIEAAEEVEKRGEAVKSLLRSDVLKKIAKGASTVYKLYPNISKAIKNLQELEKNPDADVRPIQEVQGDAADADALLSIAEWDKWIEDANNGLALAVSEKVDGAAAFQSGLRKHSINGKLLAQAKAEAIKSAQEYIHAYMEVVLNQKDFRRLTELETEFRKNQKLTEEVEVRLYDRYMAVRTSILIQMRNVAWAYKFAVLDNYPIQIDPLKNVQDYRKDLSDLVMKLQRFKEQYPGGPSRFDTKIISSQNLPVPYNAQIVEQLKASNKSTFTFIPKVPKTHDHSPAGPFYDGSHFRINRLEITLVGAKSNVTDQNEPDFAFKISTSGVYNDILKSDIFNFVGPVFSREYSYNIVDGKPVTDTAFTINTNEYSAPPPFTSWTIEITNPGSLDLSGLTSMDLQWHGEKYNEEFLG